MLGGETGTVMIGQREEPLSTLAKMRSKSADRIFLIFPLAKSAVISKGLGITFKTTATIEFLNIHFPLYSTLIKIAVALAAGEIFL